MIHLIGIAGHHAARHVAHHAVRHVARHAVHHAVRHVAHITLHDALNGLDVVKALVGLPGLADQAHEIIQGWFDEDEEDEE